MSVGTRWRTDSESICKRLEKIEFIVTCDQRKNLLNGKDIKKIFHKLEKVFDRLNQESYENCFFGTYRNAVEHYECTLRILKSKITKKNIEFPASLISQQEKVQLIRLKSDGKFQSLGVEEKAIMDSIIRNLEKKLAHIFGNRLVLDKTDSFGRKLEGMSSEEALELFINLMNAASAKFPHIFSDSNDWENLTSIFHRALVYEKILTFQEGTSVSVKKNAHETISLMISKDLDRLKIGGKLGISWGTMNRGGGHAMFLLIIKNESTYNIELYNTGDGKKYHPQCQVQGVAHWVERLVYRVSESQTSNFKEFLHHILEPLIYGKVSSEEKFPSPFTNPFDSCNSRYEISELYSYLSQYEQLVQEVNQWDHWSQGNLSGICSIKCLQAVVCYQAKEVANHFKLFYQSEILRLLFRFKEHLINCNRTVQMLLAYAIPNLSRHLKKIGDSSIAATFLTIDELEGWHSELRQFHISISSSNPPLTSPHNAVSLAPLMVEACEAATNSSIAISNSFEGCSYSTIALYRAPEVPQWNNSSPISLELFQKWLMELKLFAVGSSQYKDMPLQFSNYTFLIDALFREIYRPFLEPSLLEQKNALKSELQQSEKLTVSTCTLLLSLLDCMTETISSTYPHADGFVIAQGIYIVLTELLQIYDGQLQLEGHKRLDHYSLLSPMWKLFKEIKLTNMLFYDSGLSKDYHLVSEAFIKMAQGEKKPFFVDLSEKKEYYTLSNCSAEFLYVESHLDNIAESQKLIAHQEYERLQKTLSLSGKGYIPEISKWMTAKFFCCYEEYLPKQFKMLKDAHFAISQLVPWGEKGGERVKLLEILSFFAEGCTIIKSSGIIESPIKQTLSYPFIRFNDNKIDENLQFYEENRIVSAAPVVKRASKLATAVDHPIRMLTLIDAYRHNFKEMKLLSNQKWLSNVLFSPQGLTEVLKVAPHLFEEFTAFFEKAIEAFIASHATASERSKYCKEDTIATLFSQYLTFLLIAKGVGIDPDRKKFDLLRSAITCVLPKVRDALHYLLLNTLINSYQSIKNFNEEELIQIIKGLFALRNAVHAAARYGKEIVAPPSCIFVVYKHLKEIRELLVKREVGEGIAKWLLKNEGIDDDVVDCNFQAFPIATIATSQLNYTFDLLEGRLVHPILQGKGYTLWDVKTHRFYEKIAKISYSFNSGSRFHPTWEEKDHCITAIGDTRFHFYADNVLEREHLGEWHRAISMPKRWEEWYPPFAKMFLFVPHKSTDDRPLSPT